MQRKDSVFSVLMLCCTRWYKVVRLYSLQKKIFLLGPCVRPLCVGIQIKNTKLYFHVILFIVCVGCH